jgi:hypothetical protein
MLLRYFYIICCTLYLLNSHAQQKQNLMSSSNGLQYGFSVKALLEFSTQKNTQKPHFKIALAAGIGSSFIDNNIYPTINTELLIYNNGLGSHKPGSLNKPELNVDLITALTLTAGIKDFLQTSRRDLFLERNVPLYYFADHGYPSLRNPFAYSFSIGTNFIVNSDPNKKFQRTGFINLHIDRFQLSYSNDGGSPISDIYLGDRRDRYYTGSIVLSYHGKPNTAINLIELSYHKFTGYTRNAFEVTNQFDFAFVNYKQEEQRFYNKSLWSLNIANPVKGYGVNLRQYNKVNWDVQHLIHWAIFNSYHVVPYKEHFSVNGDYYFSNTSIGIK